jgi:hypothetical protein
MARHTRTRIKSRLGKERPMHGPGFPDLDSYLRHLYNKLNRDMLDRLYEQMRTKETR